MLSDKIIHIIGDRGGTMSQMYSDTARITCHLTLEGIIVHFSLMQGARHFSSIESESIAG